jgi:hypothetical protein
MVCCQSDNIMWYEVFSSVNLAFPDEVIRLQSASAASKHSFSFLDAARFYPLIAFTLLTPALAWHVTDTGGISHNDNIWSCFLHLAKHWLMLHVLLKKFSGKIIHTTVKFCPALTYYLLLRVDKFSCMCCWTAYFSVWIICDTRFYYIVLSAGENSVINFPESASNTPGIYEVLGHFWTRKLLKTLTDTCKSTDRILYLLP